MPFHIGENGYGAEIFGWSLFACRPSPTTRDNEKAMSSKSSNEKFGRDSLGRFMKGGPGGPGRPKRDQAAIVQGIMDAIEPHVRAAVEQTIVRLLQLGAIPAGSATRVLDALANMPLWLDVGDRRRAKSIFYPPEQQSIAGLPEGEAVRRCRAAMAEFGFSGYEDLAASDHEDAWIAREILEVAEAYRKKRDAQKARS